MAANEYYNSVPVQSPTHANYETPGNISPRSPRSPQFKSLPAEPYRPYSPHRIQSPAPYSAHRVQSPTPYETQSPIQDTAYRPYNGSHPGAASDYYAGGRDQNQSTYDDDVPLRQYPSKDSANAQPDPFPDDPALIDRPTKERHNRRNKPWYARKRIPWAVYTLTLIQCIVFIVELSRNGVLTKSPIEIHPQFNPMIGPSPYVLINMGARYVPCMRKTKQGSDTSIQWPCPNTTSTDLNNPTNQCKLNQLCGFNDKEYTEKSLPDQSFRFFIPIFLHAGFVHIGFNMILQILVGGEMEREIGTIRFILVYILSGIFGFVLGGNFAPQGIASTGASGSLFGIIALMLLDLFYHWGERRSPWVDLAWLLFDIVISFVLGLLPGLDNFSHIGGFLMGLMLGISLLHSPDPLRRRIGADSPAYGSARQPRKESFLGIMDAIKNPVGFVKGRKPLWWVWWLVRAAMLVVALIVLIVLIKNFYLPNPKTCKWCKYLSCIDIKGWCNIGQLTTTSQPKQSPNRRSLLFGPAPADLRNLL